MSAPDLAGRYGRDTSPGRRRARTLAIVAGAAAGLSWVVWAGLGQASADVRFSEVGFRVMDDQRVEVTYDIGKDPTATAVCTVQALDRSKGTVGLVQVTIGPTTAKVTRNIATVRTSAPAVAAIVRDCELAL